MAKQRGHRATKANDSFGTINDNQLYRGKYRDEVYEDDDEVEQEAADPSQKEEEATPEATSFAEPKEGSDTDYKKRYDDLKRHYDAKLEEFKTERQQLIEAQQAGKDSGLAPSQLPKTPQELEEFKEKYPDVYAIVETVSSLQAENRMKELKDEVQSLKGQEQKLKVESAYKDLLARHPDFTDIKTDERFLGWLDKQPASIADGIYKNNTDAVWAARVVDLYKADMGITTKQPKKSAQADPAASVKAPKARDIATDGNADKKMWKASEIGKLKAWQFEKFEKEIDAARAEGRIDYSR